MTLLLAITFAVLLAPFGAVARWCGAHQVELVGTAAALALLCRAVPAEHWAVLERDWPRVANVARLLRAIAPDVLKAARVAWAIWTGRPWPTLPAVPAPRPAIRPPPGIAGFARLRVLIVVSVVALASLPLLLVGAISGCAGTQLPMGGISRGAEVWGSERWGKCLAVSVDYLGGRMDGGISLSAHTCVAVSSAFLVDAGGVLGIVGSAVTTVLDPGKFPAARDAAAVPALDVAL